VQSDPDNYSAAELVQIDDGLKMEAEVNESPDLTL
jgi:hypothetical protein